MGFQTIYMVLTLTKKFRLSSFFFHSIHLYVHMIKKKKKEKKTTNFL